MRRIRFFANVESGFVVDYDEYYSAVLPLHRRAGAVMEPTFPTPRDLVEGLHSRHTRARRELHHLLAEPIARLMRELIDRYQLDADHDLLVLHALHLAETTLRVRPPAGLDTLSWTAFRAGLLLQLARLAIQPFGATTLDGAASPLVLPHSAHFHHQTFFRPSMRIGTQFFGGDWYAGHQADDGSYWIFVADVTGHGYYAYLLATALPAVWQRTWASASGPGLEPADLLTVMHELLADCLPDGIFLECALLRLRPDGEVVVASAGRTRLLVHPVNRPASLIRLRGAWLGLRPPTRAEQFTLHLDPRDEMILTTDGVFDQLADQGGVEPLLAARDGHFHTMCETLDRSVAARGQKDDITMLLVRRQETAQPHLRLPLSPTKGAADVPV